MPIISIVIPVYGCVDCVISLYKRLVAVLESLGYDFEIIMVNDSSPDGSWRIVTDICSKDNRVKGVNLSRNFGQHHAISAGLDISTGDYVVVMDCDLQDSPEEIPLLLEKMEEGYDIVLGRRVERQDSWFKKKSSEYFYKVLSFLTDTKLDSNVANFGVYKRKVIRAVCSMSDQIRFFPAMVQWVGFTSATVDIKHNERLVGTSSYSLGRLLKLASNVILTFSNKPLKIIVGLGFSVSAAALVYAAIVFWRALFGGIAVPGWSSVIISVWFLSGGHMIVAGLVGIYVGKIFDATKRRPRYVVTDLLNIDIDNK
jgi:polyisoprenyl-phosphate glycosyltransferase